MAAPVGDVVGPDDSCDLPSAAQLLVHQGGLHDSLWCKYALEMLQDLHRNSNSEDLIFSLGPSLSLPGNFFTMPMDSDHQASLPPEQPAEEFEFRSAGFEGDMDLPSIQPADSPDVMWFRIMDAKPANRHVAPGSWKPSETSLAIQKVRATWLDRAVGEITIDSRVSTEIGEREGINVSDVNLLSAGSMSVNDFNTLRKWETRGLTYSLGFSSEEEKLPYFQEVVGNLLGTYGEATAPYFVGPEAEAHAEKLDVLKHLQAHGQARNLHDGSYGWLLTSHGDASLRVTKVLSVLSSALRPRTSLPIEDLTTFELMCLMADAGWTCREKRKGKKNGRTR